MWEWTPGGVEQAVMFYDATDRGGKTPPPMTDSDCRRLADALRNPTPRGECGGAKLRQKND